MNKESIIESISFLFSALRDISQWHSASRHIDELDQTSSEKKRWFDDAISLYLDIYSLAQRCSIPGHMFVTFYLKECTNQQGLNINSKQKLIDELNSTPPEMFLFAQQYPGTNGKYIAERECRFLPYFFDGYFHETYDKKDKIFRRSLALRIKKKHLFNVMIRETLKAPNPTNNKQEYAEATEFIENIAGTTNKSLNNFWLATLAYYYFDDAQKAKKILQKSLDENINQPDCLSFLYKIMRETEQPTEDHIYLLEKAIDLAPAWILPRFQYFQYCIMINNIAAAELCLQSLLKLVKRYRTPKNILQRFYAVYVTGNIPKNVKMIKILDKFMQDWKKQHNYQN